jgi:hypothetical protein
MFDTWLIVGFIVIATITRGVQSNVAVFISLIMGSHLVVDWFIPDTYMLRFGLAATFDAITLIYLLRHTLNENMAIKDIALLFFISMLVNIFMGISDTLGVDAYSAYYSFSILLHTLILIMVFLDADNGDNTLCKLVNIPNTGICRRVQKAGK